MPSTATLKLIAYALGAAALAAVAWLAWGQFTDWIREPVVAERDEARADLKTCRESTAALEAKLDSQNAAVKALQTVAIGEEARRKAATEAAREEGRLRAQRAYESAAAMLQSPPLDEDPCVSAAKRARQFIEERRRP